MSGSGRPRRGPAPIASFDHDASDESSPETKQTFRLPEIREDPAAASSRGTDEASGTSGVDSLAPPDTRARSHSSPAVHTAATINHVPALAAPAAPRIDISRASSSSHHDSRDSSPEMALFSGNGGGEENRARLELGFREDGALDLRSSTEELAFLEGTPANEESRAPPTAPPSRRHSRKDSQCSETALLAVSGRTSRLSSVGSQCSAHSALSGFSHTSRVSRLSVVSGTSRSPSPHKMLLETSFCGPKPIETDPEICAAAVEERLLEIAKLSTETVVTVLPVVDSRDHREVRTEATVESTSSRSSNAPRVTTPVAPPTTPKPVPTTTNIPASSTILRSAPSPGPAPKPTSPIVTKVLPVDEDKKQKETKNRARVEERKSKAKCLNSTQTETHKNSNRSRDIIRIKLKPDEDYDDDEEDESSDRTLMNAEPARKPASLELNDSCIQSMLTKGTNNSLSPLMTQKKLRESRTPSPSGVSVSRKSSFCSLFKSRETIASPDSPSDALKRKKSINEGRSRSKSRDRSVTPTSTGKIKGSMLSLFKTPRKSVTSPSPSPRDGSPIVQAPRQFPQTPVDRTNCEKLKYYEDTKDGIIHIPLRTPPDEKGSNREKGEKTSARDVPRPSSAPQVRSMPDRPTSVISSQIPKLTQRTVLPDGSIIIPLHSPTEKNIESPKTKRTESSLASTTIHTQAVIEKQVQVQDVKTNAISKSVPPELCSNDVTSPAADAGKIKRKERLIFSTHVGSREQVFSTQFSITKTPSVTSEISDSIPSFPESDEIRPTMPQIDLPLVSTVESPSTCIEVVHNVTSIDSERVLRIDSIEGAEVESEPGTPQDTGRDSSESEGGSEAVTHRGSDVERRGLVIQESFEELPYVPTTLPQERSLALPIVPVRERGGVHVTALQRPRGSRSGPSLPGPLGAVAAPSASPVDASAEPLRIHLPRRSLAAVVCTSAAPPRPERSRTRSGSEVVGVRSKSEWIDFTEVPERRKQAKRIQTLPASTRDPVVFSYVPVERCQCECHGLAHPPADDQLPLLQDDGHQMVTSTSSSLEGGDDTSQVQLNLHIAPFTADLDLHNHTDRDMEPQ